MPKIGKYAQRIWQSTLEEIIRVTGDEGPASIAALAIDGVVRAVKEREDLQRQVSCLKGQENRPDDYPNLVALTEGRVSARISEWSRVKSEAKEILEEVACSASLLF